MKKGKLRFVSPFHYELQAKQCVTIFGHKKKDRVLGMKFVVKKSIKYDKKQGVRHDMWSGVRNDVFLWLNSEILPRDRNENVQEFVMTNTWRS